MQRQQPCKPCFLLTQGHFKKEVRTMRKILNLQALVADEEVNLHAASNRSVQCKTSSYKSWFGC